MTAVNICWLIHTLKNAEYEVMSFELIMVRYKKKTDSIFFISYIDIRMTKSECISTNISYSNTMRPF